MMINLEILQDILTDHKLCNTQREELEKAILILSHSDDIDIAYLEKCQEVNRLNEENRWIPVSERLPEEDGIYLVTEEIKLCNKLSYIIDTVLYDKDNSYWHYSRDNRIITAWKPLPKPYTEVSE